MGDMSRELYDALIVQIGHEIQNNAIYENISSLLKFKGLNNLGKYFYIQSQDELRHKELLINFLNDRNEIIIIPTVDIFDVSDLDFNGIADLFLVREKDTTNRIKLLISQALSDNDMLSYVFLLDFIKEQIEEESQAYTIVDIVKPFNNNLSMLILFDQSYEVGD